MTDQPPGDLTDEERALHTPFSGVTAPPSIRRWNVARARRHLFARPADGGLRMGPLTAAVAVALVAGIAGGALGIHAHLATAPSGTAATSGWPQARTGAVFVADAAAGTVVLFGGRTAAGGLLGDTWTWNGDRWTELHPAHSPSARSDSVSAYDAATQRVVVFGGFEAAQPATAAPTCVPPGLPLPASGAVVGIGAGGATTAGGSGGTVSVQNGSGGASGATTAGGPGGTVSVQNGPGGTVSVQNGSGGPVSVQSGPGVASGATTAGGPGGPVSVQNGSGGPVSVQSGSGGPVSVQSGSGGTVSVQNGSDGPVSVQSGPGGGALAVPGSAAGTVTVQGGSVSYTSGSGSGSSCGTVVPEQPVADFWTWDGHDWQQQRPATGPANSGAASMAYDEARNELVLVEMGGGVAMPAASSAVMCPLPAGAKGSAGATDGATGTAAGTPAASTGATSAPAGTPAPSTGATSTSTALRCGVLMAQEVTWTGDGAHWTKHAGSVAGIGFPGMSQLAYDPSVRAVRSFAAPPCGVSTSTMNPGIRMMPPAATATTGDLPAASGVVVSPCMMETQTASPPAGAAVGRTGVAAPGAAPTTMTMTVRTWDGATWHTEAIPSVSPPVTHPLAQDRDHSLVGLSFDGRMYRFNGRTWSQLHPAKTPPEQAGTMIAWDPSHGQTLVFGGDTAGGPSTELWSWDGTNWARLGGTVPPPPPAPSAPPAASPPASCPAAAVCGPAGCLSVTGGALPAPGVQGVAPAPGTIPAPATGNATTAAPDTAPSRTTPSATGAPASAGTIISVSPGVPCPVGVPATPGSPNGGSAASGGAVAP